MTGGKLKRERIEARKKIKNDEEGSVVKLDGDRTLSPGECCSIRSNSYCGSRDNGAVVRGTIETIRKIKN